MSAARFDWPALIAAGQRFGLAPDVFWALTPQELARLVTPRGAAAPLGRAGLDALMAAYPDKDEKETRDGGI